MLSLTLSPALSLALAITIILSHYLASLELAISNLFLFSLCSGPFQMSPDVFSLLFTIKKKKKKRSP